MYILKNFKKFIAYKDSAFVITENQEEVFSFPKAQYANTILKLMDYPEGWIILEEKYLHSRKKNPYFRTATYSIDEVLPYIGNNEKLYDGDWIYMGSSRYQNFAKHGVECVVCGLKGEFFAKERCKNQDYYHFNLYAYDKNGKEVMMTKDHIIPKSKGGKNELDNYQPMCKKCNSHKGNKDEINYIKSDLTMPITCNRCYFCDPKEEKQDKRNPKPHKCNLSGRRLYHGMRHPLIPTPADCPLNI